MAAFGMAQPKGHSALAVDWQLAIQPVGPISCRVDGPAIASPPLRLPKSKGNRTGETLI